MSIFRNQIMNKKLLANLQIEVDAAWQYRQLALLQDDHTLAEVFNHLAEIEDGHAAAMYDKLKLDTPTADLPGPSRHARMQMKLGKVFGYDFILSGLSNIERQVANADIRKKLADGSQPSGMEHNHLRILESVSDNKALNLSGGFLSRVEGRHKTVGGNALRAAVLGANDGLVSNMSLVMGVAGAAANNHTILVTGVAGLLAGAISMSLGEWLSVQSSRELYQKQIALEAEELEASPEQEQKELELIYQAKGMPVEHAVSLAAQIMQNKEHALDTLVKEELGIDKDELGGSAWEAAFASFFLFAIGAILPVLPFIFMKGEYLIPASLGFSVIGLFLIGAATTLFTSRNVWASGFRQIIFGLAASGVTFLIGRLLGVSLAG